MRTDTSEKGLESFIVEYMTGHVPGRSGASGMAEEPEPFVGLHHWLLGSPDDNDRAYALDLAQLSQFLRATQPRFPKQSRSRVIHPRADGSWHAYKVRSRSAALSMCYARASRTGRTP